VTVALILLHLLVVVVIVGDSFLVMASSGVLFPAMVLMIKAVDSSVAVTRYLYVFHERGMRGLSAPVITIFFVLISVGISVAPIVVLFTVNQSADSDTSTADKAAFNTT
jgi:hypothetical protein